MEEKDKIIVKWAQEDVETSNNLLNNNKSRTRHDFRGQKRKRLIEHKMCVLIFSAIFVRNVSRSTFIECQKNAKVSRSKNN